MLTLRPATAGDAALLLAWRNDPATRSASFSTDVVAADDHEIWLTGRLADPACRLWIAQEDDRPVGQVRLDSGPGATAEIAIGLAPEARGRGLGTAIIAMACRSASDTWQIERIVARVRPDNAASLRAFGRAGFVEADRSPRAVVLALPAADAH